ncbi:MAG: zinc-finger domain-containing protein [Rhodospirillales bacterium]|nr:zinc-finger domain-containing protein [Rhodospirillales bacterium]MDE2391012.1 zinc-finger domain-containing protein [Rhodospirillales bacterium]MDE2459500.1 zinc-finger domain-containing protein [Rhodospirillales bacterium]
MSVQTDSINHSEIIHVTTRSVSCDGGVGPLGHPKVYLRIPGEQVACPYCSRIFILDGEGADESH